MMNHSLSIFATGVVATTAMFGPHPSSADIAVLGSKDFYPSPEHPVGFLGDGSGHFPGATPVDHWQDGTPTKITLNPAEKKPISYWALGDDKKVNIVWKTNMPGWVNSRPIVVGDLAFTYAEPNQLVCVDVNTGTLLWTRATNVYAVDGRDPKLAEQLNQMREIRYVLGDFGRGVGTNPPYDNKAQLLAFGDFCESFGNKVIPRLVEALKKIDPQGDYASVVAKATTGYQNAAQAYRSGDKPADGRKPPFEKGEVEACDKMLEQRIASLLANKKKDDEDSRNIPWGNMIGWQMSVPTSDGQDVYASLGQGATACYDLQGNLVWVKHMPCKKGNYCSTVYSPLLVAGWFIDVHIKEELVALDGKTGAEKWRTPARGDFSYAGDKSRKIGSPKVMTLPGPDGKPAKVIVTIQGNVIRPADGKSLCAIPFNEGSSPGGCSVLSSGSIMMMGGSGDAYSPPHVAYQRL